MDPELHALEREKLELERTKVRLDYLTRLYGFYTGHMNQVFNFYLLAIALIASAFVQSLSGPNPLHPAGSIGIALSGLVLTVIFALLHRRAFMIADILDVELGKIEPGLAVNFQPERKRKGKCRQLNRNSSLFRILYAFVFVVFLGAIFFAATAERRFGRAAEDHAVISSQNIQTIITRQVEPTE